MLTASVGVPLLLLLVSRGSDLIFSSVIFIFTCLALHEYGRMVFRDSLLDQILALGFGVLLGLPIFFGSSVSSTITTGLLLLSYFSIYPFIRSDLKESLTHLAWVILGGFYLGFLVPHWALLFRLPEGRAWVFFVLLVVMTGDSVAYFAGRAFSKRKLAPTISPGKTIAGSVGYIAGSVAAGVVSGHFLFSEPRHVELMGLSIMLAILGQVGDLFESWIKRVFAVKDAGGLLPGHGGVLDRLDSLIFPAVFTTAYLRVFHS